MCRSCCYAACWSAAIAATRDDLGPHDQPAGEDRAHGGQYVRVAPWIEYGFKHVKDDLGWADYRVTDAASIERWWELVMSAYTLVSLQSTDFAALGHVTPPAATASAAPTTTEPATAEPRPTALLEAHPACDTGTGWKHQLNNLRLLLQPYVCTGLLLPWLHLLSPPHIQAVQTSLATLGSLVNTFRLALPT
jgi:hypothetical protein